MNRSRRAQELKDRAANFHDKSQSDAFMYDPDSESNPFEGMEDDDQLQPSGLIQIAPGVFHYGVTGLILDDLGADFRTASLSQKDFDDLGAILIAINDKFQLWLGDWLVAYEIGFKISYDKIADRFEIPSERLQNYKWVASSVPISLRNEMLSFSHYYAVARCKTLDDREFWIKAALYGDGKPLKDEEGKQRHHRNGEPMFRPWSVARLRREMDDYNEEKNPRKKYAYLINKAAQLRLFGEALLPLADSGVNVTDKHFDILDSWYHDAKEALKMIRRVQDANEAVEQESKKALPAATTQPAPAESA